MKTSSWFTAGTRAGRIGISRAVPHSTPAGFRRYRALEPTREILHMPDGAWQRGYVELLRRLDPQEVWDDLHRLAGGAEPILLCFERRQCDCHRGLVAEWLCEELGVQVAEFGEEPLLL
jgi:hypothetical protein